MCRHPSSPRCRTDPQLRVRAALPQHPPTAVPLKHDVRTEQQMEVYAMITRRKLLTGSAAMAGLIGTGVPLLAQTRTVDGWPNRAVRVIIPSGAGGPAETFRFYAEHLREVFGQAFVHENQPG